MKRDSFFISLFLFLFSIILYLSLIYHIAQSFIFTVCIPQVTWYNLHITSKLCPYTGDCNSLVLYIHLEFLLKRKCFYIVWLLPLLQNPLWIACVYTKSTEQNKALLLVIAIKQISLKKYISRKLIYIARYAPGVLLRATPSCSFNNHLIKKLPKLFQWLYEKSSEIFSSLPTVVSAAPH